MGWIESILLCAPLSGILWAASTLQSQLATPPMKQPIAIQQRLLIPARNRSLPSQKPPVPFPTFNSQQLDGQLQRYLRYLAESGPPDILIVGSSRAVQGVDPIALRQTLQQQNRQDLKIFNFGVNGATAQVVEFVLTRLLAPEQLPRLILWADGARAFNSGRADLTYDRIINSQGYKLLASGVRPAVPASQNPQVDAFCVDVPSSLFGNNFAPDGSMKQVPSGSASALSRFKSELLCDQRSQRELDLKALSNLTPQMLTAIQEATGFNPLSQRFNPASYFSRYPKVPGAYDGDYRSFSLQGKQAIALHRVIQFAQTRQIPVMFVNLLLTKTYLDDTRALYEQQFQAYMQRLAKGRKFTFYDFSYRWTTRHDYFMDPSHLNRYGATAVSIQLSRGLQLLLHNLE